MTKTKIGDVFGRLTVVDRAPNRGTKTCWLCFCSCGLHKVIQGTHLASGHTKSCGCYHKEFPGNKGNSATHRMIFTPTYKSWQSMGQRCNNPKNTSYSNYGGRGIKVCESWSKFINFLADMGERPADTTLNRLDNNGDYTLDNCNWANRSEQQKNKRPFKMPNRCHLPRPTKIQIGDTFGRLVVLSRAQDRKGKACWNCYCSCGKYIIIRGEMMTNRGTISCGCGRKPKTV